MFIQGSRLEGKKGGACCSCCGGGSLDKASQAIVDIILGRNPRVKTMMPGWAVEVARQKLLSSRSPRISRRGSPR